MTIRVFGPYMHAVPHVHDANAFEEGDFEDCSECGKVVWEVVDRTLRVYPCTLIFDGFDDPPSERLCADCLPLEAAA